MPESLLDHVGAIDLPADIARHIDDAAAALVEPKCTPSPDLEGLRAKLAAGITTASGLVGNYQQTSPHPGDVALAGALVQRAVPRTDVEVNGDVHVPLDQSGFPPRGQVCVPGNLTIHGDLEIVAPLVVCGDLVVDGILSDCGPQSVVVVLGNVHCRALLTSGEVLVYGSLTATVLVEGTHNDNVLEVHGTLACPALFSADHAIEAGAIEVVHRPPPGGTWGDDIFDGSAEHLEALTELITDPAVIEDGELDAFALASLATPWRPR